MSRKVLSTGVFVAANGATLALLSVPAGKKYEVLESCYYGTAAGAGVCTYDIDFDGTNALVASAPAQVAGLFVARTVFNNHHLAAGDSWYVTVANTTGGIVGRVTYVDVDV